MTTSTSKASAASTRNHRNPCMLLPCTDTNPCMLLPCTPDRHRSHHTHPPSHPSLFTLSITTTLDALSDTRRVYRVVYLSPPRVPDAFAHTRSAPSLVPLQLPHRCVEAALRSAAHGQVWGVPGLLVPGLLVPGLLIHATLKPLNVECDAVETKFHSVGSVCNV